MSCLSVCWANSGAVRKRVNRSRCHLEGGLSHVCPRNHVLDVGQDRTNPFAAARGDKSAIRPFARLLWTLVGIRCATTAVPSIAEFLYTEVVNSDVNKWHLC